MERLIIDKNIKITESVTKLLAKTQALSALVIQSNGAVEDFERVAATIVDDPAILNILLAPGGVVRHVYPLSGNENIVGFDLFGDGAGNVEARQARDTGKLVFGGPFDLVQGGKALVGRLPVWTTDGASEKKVFWGLVSVTLRFPDVLAGAGLNTLAFDGFAHEIWRINPDTGKRQAIVKSHLTVNRSARYLEQGIFILNAEWFFRIMPVRAWYEYPSSWMMLVVSVMVSVLVAAIIRNNEELRQMQGVLRSMLHTDSLTETPNRAGLFYELEQLIRKKQPFVFYYIDLDNFKQINDAFGHNTGDFALKTFCSRLSYHLAEKSRLGRLSGDEFALIREGNDSALEEEAFWAAVYEDFARPVRGVGGESFTLSFSVGRADFPADGVTPDAVISCADKRMYECKRARHSADRRRRTVDIVEDARGDGS